MGLTKNNFKVEGKAPNESADENIGLTPPKFKIETSWDDGNILDIKLASVLNKYKKLPAVFYVIVGKINEENGYLNWEQVKDLERQGFEIGSHSMSHPPDLKALYDEDLHYEVKNSKDILEAVLGHSIGKFCYPRGRYDERVQQFVMEADYVEARGTGTPGNLEAKDKYGMPGTIHIFQRPEYRGEPIFDFAKKTIDRAVADGGYVNIWGHSHEIHENNLWDTLEKVLEYAQSKV